MKRTRAFLPHTRSAARLLGSQVAVARRKRGWTATELAERVGVDRATIARIEKGDPTVGIGNVFDAAAILGVPLFTEDPVDVAREQSRIDTQLALLPARVRRVTEVNDDF